MQQISNIQNFPDGTPIDSVQAKIIATYDRKDGVGAKGPWSVQDGEIVDGSGNKLKIKVWNHPDISPMKGKEVVIHAAKQGGLKVVHDEYKGKVTIKLEVSKNGQFQLVEVWNAQNGQASAPAPIQDAGIKVVVTGDPAKQAEEQTDKSKAIVNRLANLWLACYEEAISCAATVKEARGVDLTSDQFQSCVSSLFIQATKEGANMPGGKFEMKKKGQVDPVVEGEPVPF